MLAVHVRVGQDDGKSTLSAGKLADFIALIDGLSEIAPEQITDQRVTETVVGGVVRFGEL